MKVSGAEREADLVGWLMARQPTHLLVVAWDKGSVIEHIQCVAERLNARFDHDGVTGYCGYVQGGTEGQCNIYLLVCGGRAFSARWLRVAKAECGGNWNVRRVKAVKRVCEGFLRGWTAAIREHRCCWSMTGGSWRRVAEYEGDDTDSLF